MSRHGNYDGHPRRQTYGRSSDSLCCCEYIDKKGQENHLLACCCDCEALDSAFDQFINCQKVSNSRLLDMFATIEDRLRIPSFTGKGAVKVNMDVALPVIIIPTGILLGTLHPALTILMLVFIPLSLLTCYRLWLGMKKKPRTQLFFAWGLVSVGQMYVTFECVVIPYREILLWENLLATSLFVLMLYALYHVRKDPGIVRGGSGNTAPHDMMDNFAHLHESHQANTDTISLDEHQQTQTTNHHNAAGGQAKTKSEPSENPTDSTITIEEDSALTEDQENFQAFGAIGAALLKNFGMDKSLLQMSLEERKRDLKMMTYVTPKEFVTWVDSRMTTDGSVNTWCEFCKLDKPARTGHCKVCNACVHCRDHHCVWVDMCIGGHNHRSFLAGIVLFIIGGIYGIHLSMTTICTPGQYYGWFLYPADCRYLYADFPTALIFVSSVYSMIAVFGMILVLLSQSVLISTNITSEELYKANMRGWTKRCGFVATNHALDKGFVKNWWSFLTGSRSREQSYEKATKSCQSGCACEC